MNFINEDNGVPLPQNNQAENMNPVVLFLPSRQLVFGTPELLNSVAGFLDNQSFARVTQTSTLFRAPSWFNVLSEHNFMSFHNRYRLKNNIPTDHNNLFTHLFLAAEQNNIDTFVSKLKEITNKPLLVRVLTTVHTSNERTELTVAAMVRRPVRDSLLTLAIKKSNFRMVRLLLSIYAKHAIPHNTRNSAYLTPLECAAQAGHLEIFKLLLPLHSDLRLIFDAASHATKNGYLEIVRFLLDHQLVMSFAVNQPNYYKTNIRDLLRLAAKNQQSALLELMLSKEADINYLHTDGLTALTYVALRGDLNAVRLLLIYRADINFHDSFKRTALTEAATRGHFDVVRVLLDNGATIDHETTHSTTPLMSAIRWKHNEIVNLLLERGANIHYKNKKGETALAVATIHNDRAMVQLLLKQGASINDQNKKGETALILAAERGYSKITTVLLDKGACINHLNTRGKTALEAATEKKHPAVIKILLAKLKDVSDQSQAEAPSIELSSNKRTRRF